MQFYGYIMQFYVCEILCKQVIILRGTSYCMWQNIGEYLHNETLAVINWQITITVIIYYSSIYIINSLSASVDISNGPRAYIFRAGDGAWLPCI